MFTGIVQAVGAVRSVAGTSTGKRFVIALGALGGRQVSGPQPGAASRQRRLPYGRGVRIGPMRPTFAEPLRHHAGALGGGDPQTRAGADAGRTPRDTSLPGIVEGLPSGRAAEEGGTSICASRCRRPCCATSRKGSVASRVSLRSIWDEAWCRDPRPTRSRAYHQHYRIGSGQCEVDLVAPTWKTVAIMIVGQKYSCWRSRASRRSSGVGVPVPPSARPAPGPHGHHRRRR